MPRRHLSWAVLAVSAAWAGAGCGSGHDAAGSTGDAPAPTSSALPGPWAEASDTASAEPPPPPPRPTRVGVEQILIAYKGAENAPKTVTRTKAAAQTLAADVLQKLKDGPKTFAELAKAHSDDPTSNKIGGAIGNIEEWVMPEAFFVAATALPVGGTSELVETPRGFHIIHRVK